MYYFVENNGGRKLTVINYYTAAHVIIILQHLTLQSLLLLHAVYSDTEFIYNYEDC